VRFFLTGVVLFVLFGSAVGADERTTSLHLSARVVRAQKQIRAVADEVDRLTANGGMSYVRGSTVQGHLREALSALEEAQGALTGELTEQRTVTP
jgi:hypothetical protein